MANDDTSVIQDHGRVLRDPIGRAVLEISDMTAMVACDAASLADEMNAAVLTKGRYATKDLTRLRMLEWIQSTLKLMRSLIDDIERCLSASALDSPQYLQHLLDCLRSPECNEILRTSLEHLKATTTVAWHPDHLPYIDEAESRRVHPWISRDYRWLMIDYEFHSPVHDSYRAWPVEEFMRFAGWSRHSPGLEAALGPSEDCVSALEKSSQMDMPAL